MGILVQDNGKRSELQERVTSELREKAQRTSQKEDIDLVEDSAYTKNLTKTGRFSWVWFILILLAALSVIVILVI
jgi:hypothetical protein